MFSQQIRFGLVISLVLATAGFTIQNLRDGDAKPAQRVQLPDGREAAFDQSTRQDFAKAMAKVKEGMPAKEILALLGKPHDVKTHNDPGGISASRTKEIWCYGTNGHLTLPTLGCVYIDDDGKAQYLYGGRGVPPDPRVFSEADLRLLLRHIDRAPGSGSGTSFDPRVLIQIVNTLQPLGQEKALAAIEEYLRITSWFHREREGAFLILRVLFEVSADPGFMPKMWGAPVPAGPDDPKKLPRFPIVIVDDVPFLLVDGYNGSGEPPDPESDLKYFREKGAMRGKLLKPGNNSLDLLDRFAKTVGKDEANDERRFLVRNQILNLVDSVYRRDRDLWGYKFSFGNVPQQERWKPFAADIAKLDIRWNADKARYTFKDGSHLPDPVNKLYERHTWKLDGLNGESNVITERMDANRVRVWMLWLGKADKKPSPVINATPAKNNDKALEKLQQSPFEATFADGTIWLYSWFTVELAEGEEIQVRVEVGKKKMLSPVYTP